MEDMAKLPPWPEDRFSEALGTAEYNTRVWALNLPDIYALLRKIDRTFELARLAVERDDREELVIPRLLLVQAYSGFLAAARLALGGQLLETRVLLRALIEQAWYALHIARDPAAPVRSEIWLRRDEGGSALGRCKSEFQIGKVRATHQAIDPSTERELHDLYEHTIYFGAHPNAGILAGLRRGEAEDSANYKLAIFSDDPDLLIPTTHLLAAVSIRVLKVFQQTFPMRFRLAGVEAEIEQLAADLLAVLKRHVSLKRP